MFSRVAACLPACLADVDKVTQINDDIDRMRHSATKALLERRDTIVVASVSCIYGLGMPARFIKSALRLVVGEYPVMGYADPGEDESELVRGGSVVAAKCLDLSALRIFCIYDRVGF